jgi:parallel beta-helix repeat protein
MKRESVQNIFIILFLVLGMTVSQAGAAVITVDSNGGGNYTTIQEAVDNAQNGDTVLVFPGAYQENVKVNKELTITSNSSLTGNNFSRTYVLGANPDNDVFSVSSSNVTIEGLYISGGPAGTERDEVGISLEGVSNCSLADNALIMNDIGILLSGAKGNYLVNNLISIGNDGISLVNSQENVLSNNMAVTNGHGISLNNSASNTLLNNTAGSNSVGIYLDKANGNTFVYNLISKNDYGVSCKTSQSNSLLNNSLYMNGIGVYFNQSSNNAIHGNEFMNFFSAIDEGNNMWNSSSAGNYWSDYNGTDAEGNGIGDTPYIINTVSGVADYMPLMNSTYSDDESEEESESEEDNESEE